MKQRLSLVMMALLAAIGMQAQVIAYDVQTTNTAYEDITGGTVIDLQGTVGTDLSKVLLDNDGNINFLEAEDVTAFPIGFDFGFDGKTMKYFLLTGDGAVLLYQNETVTTDIHVLGTTAAANILTSGNAENMLGAIVRQGAYGLDDTEISYKVEGTAGNRVLVIQYKNIGWQSNAWNYETEVAKSQIQYRLYEATGNIEMKVSGFKPYDNANLGSYMWMRAGIVGDKGDCLFINQYDANGATSLNQNDASVTYSATSYPADGTTWTFVAPEPCQTPAVAPSSLQLNATTTSVSGSFAFGSADHVLVLVSESNTLTAMPADKTKYYVGDVVGNAIVTAVVSSNQNALFTTPSNWVAEPATTYYVFAFGYNSLCSAGPLYNATPATASVTTKPAAPAALTVSNVELNSFSIDVTPNGSWPVLVAITDQQATDAWGDPIPYGSFGVPTGSYTAGDEIADGGTVVFFGTPGSTITTDGLVPGKTYFVRAWSGDGQGNYSSEYVENEVTTASLLPWVAAMDDGIGYDAYLPGWTKHDADEWSSYPGEYIFYSPSDYAAGATGWVETPYIYLGANGTKLKIMLGGSGGFRGMNNWALADNEKVVVQVTADGENYTDVLTIDNTTTAELSLNELTPFTAVFTEMAGQKVRMRILANRSTQGQVRIGAITLDEKSDCETPANLVVASQDGAAATIAWTPAGEENAWEVSYKKAADEEWSEPQLVSEPQVTLANLTGATSYEVRVRALCSETSTSSWSEVFTFKTGYLVPFDVDMATADLSDWGAYAGILSDDTELMPGGDVLIGAGRFGGSNHVYHPNAESHSWLVSPSVSLGDNATAEYEVSFTFTTEWAIVGGDDFSIKAVVANDGDNFSTNGVFGTIELADMPAEKEQGTYTFSFKNRTGNVRIGFYFSGQADELPWLILDAVGMSVKSASTAIEQVNAQNAQDAAVYNMQGVRVSKPTKGLYIINGKKVIVK